MPALPHPILAAVSLAISAAQTPAPATPLALARAQLSRGDTGQAIAVLRAAAGARDAPLETLILLGHLLVRSAPEEQAEFAGRLEAEAVLSRALTLDAGDPRVYLELGLLRRKQQVRVDAKRLFHRARAAAERRGLAIPPADLAEVHYQLGLILEDDWEDWGTLGRFNPVAEGSIGCAGVPGGQSRSEVLDQMARVCPEALERLLEQEWQSYADLKRHAYDQMLREFHHAFSLDSSHAPAALHYLAHLADASAWEEYLSLARRLRAQNPAEPRLELFLAMGLHETGRDAEAEPLFERAIAALSPADRARFGDVRPLLNDERLRYYGTLGEGQREDAARVFWASSDPLYLMPGNARRLEHYARLAYAELRFGAPALGLRGWDADRGRIWVRYGRPKRIRTVVPPPPRDEGRLIAWYYDPPLPVFWFSKQLTYRRARLTEESEWTAGQARRAVPERYAPNTLERVLDLPVQIARFRGAGPPAPAGGGGEGGRAAGAGGAGGQREAGRRLAVEAYAGVPVDSLRSTGDAEIEAALFLLTRDYRELGRYPARLPRAHTGRVRFALSVEPGEYVVGIEALAPAAARAARYRRPLRLAPIDTVLALSDLVLADRVEPRRGVQSRRADFLMVPNPAVTYPSGQPVALYWETYGLTADSAGIARYRIEVGLRVESVERRAVTAQVIGAFSDVFGLSAVGEEWVRLAFDAERALAGGDEASDYVTLDLGAAPPGTYRAVVRVTDRLTGRSATAEREFRVSAGRSP